jgi:hypothetical protein
MSTAPAAQAVVARFTAGDRVRVRKANPLWHVRTPFYIRGQVGTVAAVCGAFPNPEERAYLRPGLPAQPLYRVRFAQYRIWPGYEGPESDSILVDIYQHWLEPA